MARFSDLPSLSVRRPVLVVVINLLIVIAGLAAVLGVEVRELPDVDRPVVMVRAFFDGASPETMDAEVTSVIEGAVARVSGVKTINAASEENNARIRGEFAPNVDLDVAASDVREAVAAIERDLPEGVEDVTIVKADADRLPVMRLALVSEKLSQESLTRLAEEDLSAELTSIPGVATVELFGDQEQVLRVVVDPIRLASYGLSIDEVANVLSSLSLDVPAGSFKSNDQLLMVRADASVWRPEAVERLAIRNDIKLGDVGQAFYGPAEAESYSLLNGRKVVGIGIVRRAQSNTIAISEAVQEAVERLNRRMRDVELIVISDDAQFIRSSVREVVVSLSIAVLVVIGVIVGLLGARGQADGGVGCDGGLHGVQLVDRTHAALQGEVEANLVEVTGFDVNGLAGDGQATEVAEAILAAHAETAQLGVEAEERALGDVIAAVDARAGGVVDVGGEVHALAEGSTRGQLEGRDGVGVLGVTRLVEVEAVADAQAEAVLVGTGLDGQDRVGEVLRREAQVGAVELGKRGAAATQVPLLIVLVKADAGCGIAVAVGAVDQNAVGHGAIAQQEHPAAFAFTRTPVEADEVAVVERQLRKVKDVVLIGNQDVVSQRIPPVRQCWIRHKEGERDAYDEGLGILGHGNDSS